MNNKMKTVLKFMTVIVVSAFLSSCGNKQNIKAPPVEALNIEVGFQQIVDEVFSKSGGDCLKCHSTYSQYSISAKLADSMLSTVTSGRMPQGGPALAPRLQQLLATWVVNGAPEVAGGAIAKDVPLEPTFDSLLVNVFAPKCLSCHSGSANAPAPVNIDFSSYSALLSTNESYKSIQSVPLLDAAEPENSDFVYFLVPQESRDVPGQINPAIMPIKELRGNPDYIPPADVTPEEVKVIIEWMRNGYPEK